MNAETEMTYDKLYTMMGPNAKLKWPWLLELFGLPADTAVMRIQGLAAEEVPDETEDVETEDEEVSGQNEMEPLVDPDDVEEAEYVDVDDVQIGPDSADLEELEEDEEDDENEE